MQLTSTHFGVEIPRIGLSTRGLSGVNCSDELTAALQTGYRFLETAQIYNNEAEVGIALRQADIPREDLFVATKIWLSDVRPYDLLWSVRESLDRLRLDYVDLLVLHWPNLDYSLGRTVDAMNEAKERQLVRNLGVANFTSSLFDEAFSLSEAPLLYNEIEYHPMLNQQKVIDAVRRKKAGIIAYGPMADGEVLDAYDIKKLALKHKKTKAQIVMRWLLQQEDIVALPGYSRRISFSECFDVFDFELSDDEMAVINKLRGKNRRVFDPEFAPDWDKSE
jgi:diketogulonate reductase-like aldo/keto reductase